MVLVLVGGFLLVLPWCGVASHAQVLASAREAARRLQSVFAPISARPRSSDVATAVARTRHGGGLRVGYAAQGDGGSDEYQVTNRWRWHAVCLVVQAGGEGPQSYRPGGASHLRILVFDGACGPQRPR